MAFLGIPSIVVSVAIMVLAVVMSVSLLIPRNIHVVIPLVSHKIDRPATSIVFVTMFTPMFFMTRRYVQIDWSIRNGHVTDDYRLRVDDLRSREVSDVDLSIKAWLADTDRHAYVGGLDRDDKSNCDEDEKEMFHG